MGNLAEVFRNHNIETSEAEIEAALARALEEQSSVSADALTELSQVELDALTSIGIRVARSPSGEQARLLSAARYAELIASSLTTAETAKLLGVSEGRIRQRLAGRQLFALQQPEGGRGHLFPLFQFHARKPLPGLAAVLAAVPSDLHPIALRNFFLSPSPDLAGNPADDEAAGISVIPQSPRDWLISGGSPEAVIALAQGL